MKREPFSSSVVSFTQCSPTCNEKGREKENRQLIYSTELEEIVSNNVDCLTNNILFLEIKTTTLREAQLLKQMRCAFA